MERCHLRSKQLSEFTQRFFVPGIIFQRDLRLDFRIIDDNWSISASCVRRIERCTGFPMKKKNIFSQKLKKKNKKNLLDVIQTLYPQVHIFSQTSV